jgi:transcription-repair coupling factor (superfamily II helicase)
VASFSETLSVIPRKPGRWTIAGLPEGADALALAELARTTGGQDILHVAHDHGRRISQQYRRIGSVDELARCAQGVAFDLP